MDQTAKDTFFKSLKLPLLPEIQTPPLTPLGVRLVLGALRIMSGFRVHYYLTSPPPKHGKRCPVRYWSETSAFKLSGKQPRCTCGAEDPS